VSAAGEGPYRVPDGVRGVGPTVADIYAFGGTDAAVTCRLAATSPAGERPDREEIAAAAGHTAAERDVETDSR
jgi:hypothetical protein